MEAIAAPTSLTHFTFKGQNLSLEQNLWTIKQYDELFEKRIITEQDKIELLFGKIVNMSPFGPGHSACMRKIQRYFIKRFDGQYSWGSEVPLELPDFSKPEPDFTVLDYDPLDYLEVHPHAGNCYVVIEVADSSLAFDRKVKSVLYASANIPEYWIVNIIDRQIERHIDPDPENGRYLNHQIFNKEDVIQHTLFGQVAVADIIP
ncbi:MAG: Uma2 family endonuclease [Bacteroidota bacterium]